MTKVFLTLEILGFKIVPLTLWYIGNLEKNSVTSHSGVYFMGMGQKLWHCSVKYTGSITESRPNFIDMRIMQEQQWKNKASLRRVNPEFEIRHILHTHMFYIWKARLQLYEHKVYHQLSFQFCFIGNDDSKLEIFDENMSL